MNERVLTGGFVYDLLFRLCRLFRCSFQAILRLSDPTGNGEPVHSQLQENVVADVQIPVTGPAAVPYFFEVGLLGNRRVGLHAPFFAPMCLAVN